jgi:23S rRNA (adenine2503-C2)-methyltransferase
MTDLPRELRARLAEQFTIFGSVVCARLEDTDGTVKIGLTLQDGAAVEAVLLSDGADRKTVCLSTQSGCPVGCVFCKTGSLGFTRSLDAREIVEQFLHIAREAAHLAAQTDEAAVSNIVVMGMGEPLLNLQALREALAIITANAAAFAGLSPRRITVSTSGIAAGIREMAAKGPRAELAVSIPSAREELRRRLMPGLAGTSLETLKAALLDYQRGRERRITLETVLLGGVNTSPEDAAALRNFARGLFAVVNLIPWNPVSELSFEGRPLKEPDPAEINRFAGILEDGGLRVTRRYRKGRNVSGACGQLGGRVPACS